MRDNHITGGAIVRSTPSPASSSSSAKPDATRAGGRPAFAATSSSVHSLGDAVVDALQLAGQVDGLLARRPGLAEREALIGQEARDDLDGLFGIDDQRRAVPQHVADAGPGRVSIVAPVQIRVRPLAIAWVNTGRDRAFSRLRVRGVGSRGVSTTAIQVRAAVAALLVMVGCSDVGSASRTVLVDFSHDRFASFLLGNFPSEIEVTPGTELLFKQTWTGEPHTVTGGTLVDKMMATGKPWTRFFDAVERLESEGVLATEPSDSSFADELRSIEQIEDDRLKRQFFEAYDDLVKAGVDLPDRKNPGDLSSAAAEEAIGREANDFFEKQALPSAFGEEDFQQSVAQPCYRNEGAPPGDPSEPCPQSQQRQPTFNGKASYYNSGVIAYEGLEGNTFRVRLSEDIAPGTYFFYCAVHGPGQATEVRVRPEGTDVPSQAEVNRRARKEISELAAPLLELFDDARDGRLEVAGAVIPGPFAGLTSDEVHGSVNEFIPETIRTKVGEKVTWRLIGADHTISFDVPRYFPIIRFAKDGTVSMNRTLREPAGGAPEIPEEDPREGILKVDGGTYDGRGFYSTGLFGAQPFAEFSLEFSRPGRYRYACLVHPPMVGTVVVTPDG